MFSEATTLIENRLEAMWTTTPIDWDNFDYDPKYGTTFVRLQIEWVDTKTASVGGRDRASGYVTLSLFVPFNSGMQSVSAICDDLAAIYNKWDTGNLKFLVGRVIRRGRQEEWFRMDVVTSFTYDECNT